MLARSLWTSVVSTFFQLMASLQIVSLLFALTVADGELLVAAAVNSVSSAPSIFTAVTGVDTSVTPGCSNPHILHGNVRDEGTGNHSVMSVVEINCHSGYRFPHIKSTVLQVICRADGTWTDLLGIEDVPACEQIGGCPVPRITNGNVIPKYGGFMPGDMAVVTCNSRFVLMPKNVKPFIMCNKDGVWSAENSDFPTCEDTSSLSCSYPSHIENGNFQFVGGNGTAMTIGKVGSGVRVLYYCNNDYRMSTGMSPIIECIDGSWSSPPPSCQPPKKTERCGPAPNIAYASYYVVNGSLDHGGSFRPGAKLVYVCNPGYHPECPLCSPSATCMDGEWIGHGPKCIPELGCPLPPPSVPHAAFVISRRGEDNDLAYPNVSRVQEGAHASYYCNNGFHILDPNSTILFCRNGDWLGSTPSCVKRTGCDPPMDIENGNWIIQSLFADFRFGVLVTYECDLGYKAIGATDIRCLTSGYWSDYPPKCLAKDEYCSEPLPVRDGFFMCKPSQCDSFKVGTELHYVCNKNYKLSTTDRPFVQTCLPGGHWSQEPPVCLPGNFDFVVGSNYVTHAGSLTTNTVTVVVSSSCAVLGLLVVVMLAVAVQRRLKPLNSVRICPPSLPGSSAQSLPGAAIPYPVPVRDGDEHDRLALIAFADDVRNASLHAPLPSYEEAMRGSVPHVYHGFSHFVDGGNSRTSSGRSSRSGEYRQLPSIRLVRDSGLPAASACDPRRNSIVTTASNNLSVAAFGSIDTVNGAASDATSTSVTVDTYDSMASNPSIVASQRATAGSIESSSTHGSLASEAAPLLDAACCDTMRSQSSRGAYSDTASCIVEVSEENKLD